MIKEIKWKDSPILGNLNLSFEKPDGSIYNTVVFVGDNGCGKTTILNDIVTFLNGGSFSQFEYIRYDVDGKTYRNEHLPNNDLSASSGFHNRVDEKTNIATHVVTNKNTNFQVMSQDPLDLRSYGFAYSRARSGFQTNKIDHTSTGQVDDSKYNNDNEHNNDFTNLKQLIIDIQSQDDRDYSKLGREVGNPDYKEFSKTSRVERFRKAFNSFFEDISFDGVDNSDARSLDISFTKYGHKLFLDSLSTGEKQIVFRGTQLLKNANLIKGGVVMVDEPELSMHPKWQSKILRYYRNLFIENGNQTVQLFFATHSEEVLKNALKDNNVLVVVLSNKNGTISARRVDVPSILPTITSGEINYLAFDVVSTDFHIALFSHIQSTNSLTSIKNVDSFVETSSDYDSAIHYKPSSFRTVNYHTLPVYIRNAIDHPESGNTYTSDELRISIELLIKLI